MNVPKNIYRRYIGDTRGNMMMLAGVSLSVFMVCAAGVSDYSMWQSQKAKLQDAADAAALAGAVKLGKGGNKIERSTKAQAAAFASEGNDTTLQGFVSDVQIDTTAETVEVALSVEVPRMFSSMISNTVQKVRATAIAKVVYGKTACLYVLDPTGNGAVTTTGNALVTATNCSIQINSISSTALTNGGNAIFTAEEICVNGNYTGSGYTPTPTPNCGTAPDPFASLAVPTAGLCDYTNLSIGVSTTLTPGTYCGGIRITSSGTIVTLSPGTYFIKDGDLKVSSSGSVIGDEVAFVLEGLSSIDISGTGEVSTTPPTSGVLEGYSVAQSRTEPLGPVSKITGEGKFSFPGIIYMPRGDLEITGKASTNTFTPSYAAIVVYQLKIAGSGELHVTANTDTFSQQASSTITKSSARLIH